MPLQPTVLIGLAAVLVAGFVWYERSRPPARLVALVAALAALAVAGRLAFAPLPNVVATTDIALLTGYALGPAPGFAVGALAAPISNIWLGQGPWTIWQMAGWGMAGLIGAGLARVWGRDLGRLALASACAAAAVAYGALLDLSVMVTYGGEQSLERYLVFLMRGLPFTVAHAAGNFAIAFAIGPALVRMLARYRTRFEFSWRPAGAVPLAVVGAILAAGLVAPAPVAEAAGVTKAKAWLERAQNADGGYSFSPGSPSNVRMTGWAMLGLEAAGRNPLDVRKSGNSPVSYLRSNAGRLAGETGTLQLAILALEGAGLDSRGFAGRNLVRTLHARQASNGSFDGQANLTAYGIFALRAAGASTGIGKAADWLRSAQNRDGGWGHAPARRSDPDSTGSAIEALVRAGRKGRAVSRGVSYLRRTQKPEGGWGLAETGITNTQSTAWVVAGLSAAGVNPASVRKRGRSGLQFLAARQAADGHYRYSSRSDQTPVWVTSYALIALGGKGLPIPAVARSKRRSARSQAGATTGTGGAGGDRNAGAGAGQRERERAGSGRGGSGSDPAGGRAETGDRESADGNGGGDAERLRATAAEAVAGGGSTEIPASGGDSLALYTLGGLGLLAAALAGGFLVYRRRL